MDRDALIVANVQWAKDRGRWHGYRNPPDDVEGIALEALIEAATAFDPERGLTFREFALTRIIHRIKDARRAEGITSRGHTPPPRRRTDRLSTGLQRTLSRPAPQGDIVDARRALERMAALPERLQRVLAMRAEGWNLKEIGTELGVTESRACQLLKEALGLL